MLSGAPIDAGEKQIALWRRLKPLTTRQFSDFWVLVSPTIPMTDVKTSKFNETEIDSVLYRGMVHIFTG